MIEINDKSTCCGCHACANVCPNNCVTMKRDEEGFLYPVINNLQCVNCGLCESVCPEINVKIEIPFEQDGYIIQIKDDIIRAESTAGGAFTALARYFIKNNGIVFGVSMDEKFLAHHIYVDTDEELKRFRNSKYIQSTIGESLFKQIKLFLEEERLVCFSGTPCQIEGLKCFLRKEYDNLLTVDVVCRAVPSPMVFEKYLELQKKILGEAVKKVRFRDKYYGYKYSTLNIKTENNKGKYHRGIESDPWLRAFFSNICDRPSCYQCSFRKRYRVSDITIWDCFDVYKFSKEMDDDKGTTRMLVHTDKGRKILSQIKGDINYLRLDPENLVYGVKEMFESVEKHPKREAFFEDLQVMDGDAVFRKYFPNTMKVRAEHLIRIACNKLGIYAVIKRVFVYLFNK